MQTMLYLLLLLVSLPLVIFKEVQILLFSLVSKLVVVIQSSKKIELLSPSVSSLLLPFISAATRVLFWSLNFPGYCAYCLCVSLWTLIYGLEWVGKANFGGSYSSSVQSS